MIKKLFNSELSRGAIILVVSMNIFWGLNFLFHFSMGRLLGPENYGILAVLMSLVYIYSVPVEAIENLITNYTSKFNLKSEIGKIKFLMLKSLKTGFLFSTFLFFLLFILSYFLSSFLKINFWLIVFSNLIVITSFAIPIVRGVLQGRKKFSLYGASLITESILKLLISIALVILGFGVFGALWGIVFSAVISFIVSLEFNNKIIKSKEERTKFKNIGKDGMNYLITMLVITIIMSLDIIFAKRFFSGEIAGQYAVLSMLGKIIFFGTMAIGKAMFPLTSERNYKKEATIGLFKKSFGIVLVLSSIAVLVYLIFPEIIINMLYGSAYLEFSNYLFYLGIAFGFLSLTNLIFIYGLSINCMKKSPYLFVFIVIQIILFYLFHKTFLQYILAFMVSNAIMFIGAFFMLIKWRKCQ